MTTYAFPTGATSARYNGMIVRINPSQVWDADDPFVKDHPELFSLTPPSVSTTTNPRGEVRREVVEQATKAPGEKRATRRGH